MSPLSILPEEAFAPKKRRGKKGTSEPVAPAGLVKRMPYDAYTTAPGLRISALKEMAHSPLHYQFRLEHPRKSQPLQLGSAAHTAILEPHRFLAEYALWDERTDTGSVRSRRGEVWESFVAAHPGKRIVKADEHSLAMAMRDAVRSDKYAMNYLRHGDSEVSLFWQDGSRPCKARPDWLTNDGETDVLVGIKTARDARPIPFGNAAAKLGYHLQWGYYFDGYFAITGRVPRVVEIVVESAAPHDVVVYRIPDEIITQGHDEYRRLIERLGECEMSGEWPGSSDGEQILTLPSWVYHAEEDLTVLGLEV